MAQIMEGRHHSRRQLDQPLNDLVAVVARQPCDDDPTQALFGTSGGCLPTAKMRPSKRQICSRCSVPVHCSIINSGQTAPLGPARQWSAHALETDTADWRRKPQLMSNKRPPPLTCSRRPCRADRIDGRAPNASFGLPIAATNPMPPIHSPSAITGDPPSRAAHLIGPAASVRQLASSTAAGMRQLWSASERFYSPGVVFVEVTPRRLILISHLPEAPASHAVSRFKRRGPAGAVAGFGPAFSEG